MFEAGGKALAGAPAVKAAEREHPSVGNKKKFLLRLQPLPTHCWGVEGGFQAHPGNCRVSFPKQTQTPPVPFNEVQLRLIPLAKEQISAVFKDILNLVWPEEQGAVQLDVFFCKTHTAGSGPAQQGQHAGVVHGATGHWTWGGQRMDGPVMDE